MAIPPDLDAASLRAKAAGLRRLSRQIVPGEFQNRLLELARDYERQAANLDGQTPGRGGSDDNQPD
jgi:hypothetical protein